MEMKQGMGIGMTPSHSEPDMDQRDPNAPSDNDADNMEDGEPATPEEEKLFEAFMDAAMDVVYPEDAKGQPSALIIGNLKGDLDPKVLALFEDAQPPLSGSPQDSLAATAVLLTILIDDKLGYGAKAREGEGGGPDYDAITLHAGKSIIEHLIEISEKEGVHDFSEQDIEGVTYRAMDLYGVAARKIGKAGYDQAALKEEFISIVQANNEGKLDKVLPGLPGGAAMPERGV